jgi:hypothetical protein
MISVAHSVAIRSRCELAHVRKLQERDPRYLISLYEAFENSEQPVVVEPAPVFQCCRAAHGRLDLCERHEHRVY